MELLHLATFLVALISSIFSGMAGGGGGFIMSPYWLLIGLTPAQGASIGAFTAVGMGVSSLAAFRKTDHLPHDKRLVIILSVVTVLASILGALILPKIDVSAFKYLLAFITIAALPLLFMKRPATHRFAKHRNIGLALIIALLIVSSIITSSAFSVLMVIVFVLFFDLSILQMTALRRFVVLSQSIVLFIVLSAQGHLVWQHALVGIIGGGLGSYFGTRFAISKGESFAKWALAVGALIGALALLFP